MRREAFFRRAQSRGCFGFRPTIAGMAWFGAGTRTFCRFRECDSGKTRPKGTTSETKPLCQRSLRCAGRARFADERSGSIGGDKSTIHAAGRSRRSIASDCSSASFVCGLRPNRRPPPVATAVILQRTGCDAKHFFVARSRADVLDSAQPSPGWPGLARGRARFVDSGNATAERRDRRERPRKPSRPASGVFRALGEHGLPANDEAEPPAKPVGSSDWFASFHAHPAKHPKHTRPHVAPDHHGTKEMDARAKPGCRGTEP